jgi:hypothetical protein
VVKAIQEGGNLSYEQAWEIAKAQHMKLFESLIEEILCACAVKASSAVKVLGFGRISSPAYRLSLESYDT